MTNRVSRIVFTATVLLVLSTAAWAGENVWTPLGPEGGGQTLSLAIDPANRDTLFAGFPSGAGIWKTVDSGGQWVRSDAGIPLAAGNVMAVAVHPSDSATVYLSTSNRHVYKSTDGGATWVASYTGIAPTAPGTASSSSIAFDPGDPHTIFVSWNIAGGSLYKTSDDGATWERRDPILDVGVNNLVISSSAPPRLYAALGGQGIYKSFDGASTWGPVNTGLPATGEGLFGIPRVAVDPSNPDILYAMSNVDGNVHRSSDGAASWSVASSETYWGFYGVWVQPGTGDVFALGYDINGASPTNRRSLFRSTDDGATFANLTAAYVNARAIAFDPVATTTFFACLDDGPHKTTDGGATWSPAYGGLRTTDSNAFAFAPSDPSTLWAGFYASIGKSTDGGATFALQRPSGEPPFGEVFAIHPTDANTVITDAPSTCYYISDSLCPNSSLIRSTDGGATWTSVPNPLFDQADHGLMQAWELLYDPANPLIVYALGPAETPGVYKSIDGGVTFAVAGGTGTILWPNALVAAPTSPTTLYMATGTSYGSAPGIWRSTDQAASWQLLTNGLPADTTARSIGLDPSDPARLYIGVNAPTDKANYTSGDGGDTWTRLAGLGLPEGTLALSIAVDPVDPGLLYAGLGGSAIGIYRSFDAGANWQPFSTGMGTPIAWTIGLDPADHNRILAGTRGGLYEITVVPYTLAVSKSGNGGGTITSAPAGINCGATCSAEIAGTATVTLTATPDPGSFFYGWSGGPCSGTDPCMFAMDSDLSTVARFSPAGPDVAVTLESTPATATQGQPITYTATIASIGSTSASGVSLIAQPPIVGASVTSVSTSQGSCSGTAPVICTIGTMAPGAAVTVTMQVLPMSAGTLTMQAAVSCVGDADATNDTTVLQTACVATRQTPIGINAWTPVGPDGGAVLRLDIDPLDAHVVYASTFAGAFKSTDRGAHWTRMFPEWTAAVGPHPAVPGVVFLADRNRQIRKSFDGGATWPVTGTGIPSLYHWSKGGFVFWPGDPDTLLYYRAESIFRSTDAGLTWTEVTRPATTNRYVQIAADPGGGAPAFYLSTNYGVFKSTDAGVTWLAANTGLPFGSDGRCVVNGLAVIPGTPSTILAAPYSGLKVFASTDGGASWQQRSTDDVDRLYMLITPAGGTDVYGVGWDWGGSNPSMKEAIYVSRDLGANWSLLTTSYSLTALAADPIDPDFLYAGMAEGVYVSGNAGLTWSPANVGLHAMEAGGVAFEPGNASTMYFHGNTPGIFKTTDGGDTFTNVTRNLIDPLNGRIAMDPNDHSILYTAGMLQCEQCDPAFFDGFVRSRDGGASWERIENPNPLNPFTDAPYFLQPWGLIALPTTPTTIFVGGPTEGVFKSTDGGANFLFSSNGLPGDIWLEDLVTTDAGTTLFVADDNEGVFRSTNGGALWTSASIGLPAAAAHYFAVHPADPLTLYVTTNAGIFKTTDGGDTWIGVNTGLAADPTAVPPAIRARGIAIDPVDPEVVYATLFIGPAAASVVYTTRDAGAHWWPLNGNAGLDTIPIWQLFVHPEDHNHLYAGARGGLYETQLDLRRLGVTLAGSGSGVVTSAPGGIDCGSACFFDFPVDGVVTLTAVPDETSVFAGWTSGACAAFGTSPCQVTMSGDSFTTATFTLRPGPAGVAPNAGPTAGGQTVTITGTALSNAATVTFGGTAATNLVIVSDTSITVTTPAHVPGTVSVAVTSSEGPTGELPASYTFVDGPVVSSVTPGRGPTAGGTSVSITGNGFVSGATVTFGGAAATNVVYISGTSLTATTPAHVQGAVTVVVTNPDAQGGALANGFTYVAPATVSGVSPSTGPTAGGTSVTVTGTGFASGATVTFGDAAATNVVVASTTTITATTPAHILGAVAVAVTNSDGQSGELASAFTYVAPPTVASVTPSSGPTSGGTNVTIAGTGFLAGATVTFGGTPATSVVVASPSSITATTPAHAAGGVTVVVTHPGSQSGQLPTAFTYVASSEAAISAGSGSVCDGQTVTISVNLAGTAAPLAIEFDATFDPAKLTVTNVEVGALTAGFSISSNVSPGRVRIAMASGTPAPGISGEVARITFQAGAGMTAGNSASIGIENVLVNDATGTGASGIASCSTCGRGDVNANGQITAFDASLILQIVVGVLTPDATQACAADFNQNGSVTAFDAALVLQCVVGTGPCSY